MSASRLALVGALGAAVGWTLKAIAIGIAGGLDKSPAEGPLFLAGLVLILVGGGAFGVALSTGRPPWIRVAAAVGTVLVTVLVAVVGGSVAAALQPADPSWVWGEVNLWVAALVLLAAVLVWRGRGRTAG